MYPFAIFPGPHSLANIVCLVRTSLRDDLSIRPPCTFPLGWEAEFSGVQSFYLPTEAATTALSI